jgi:hypothetical protein
MTAVRVIVKGAADGGRPLVETVHFEDGQPLPRIGESMHLETVERALGVDDVVHHIGHGRRFRLTLSLRERDR